MSLTVSIMNGVTNSHPTTSEEANGLATDFVSEGIIGTYTNTGSAAPTTGAFSINAQGTPDMTVAVGSGVAYVQGTPASQNSQMFRVYNSASENVTISANSSGSTKYDWLYIKLDATLLNAPTLAGTTTATLVTSRSTSSSSDDGTPPTYGYPIAVITVSNGASSITNSVIRDKRNNADIGTVAGLNTGWTTGALPQVSSVTENGNRSADITFASTVASILTPGMRIRTSRTVAAPTYMGGAFNGTSHYFTKVTPTSTLSTITDNITIVAHIEPTAYAACAIAARYDSTTANGIGLQLNASGQIVVQFTNGGGGNSRIATSYQSVPLNKKSHIAATYTSTATTFVIYLDGVSIPFAVVTGGTAPTTFGTGTNDFSIGRYGANASGYFPGYISGCGVFNAVLSAATIRSYKNQVLSGSETNCIGAWSLNNTAVNQQAAGTNDLTATGGVGYTSGRSPYTTDANGVAAGTYDWAIVTKVVTTVATVQYPEGCAIPTSGGISTVDYSGVKSPFGMPVSSGRWEVLYINFVDATTAGPVQNTFYGGSTINTTIPVGDWRTTYCASFQANDAGGVGLYGGTTLSTSSSAATDTEFNAYVTSTAVTNKSLMTRTKVISLSAATVYYLLYRVEVANIDNVYLIGSTSPSIIRAELAYL